MKEENNYQICERCVMDTSDPDIVFDESGVCNHCHHYDSYYRNIYPFNLTTEKRDIELSKIVEEIKSSGNKKYNCIIGMSGGVDSSYTAYKAKQLGLNPLAVHLDNGWDSEHAVKNIELLVRKLDIDLHTHVIDWGEFRDLQKAFFRSSIIDIEILTDHAIFAVIYKIAKINGIKYFISGVNYSSESTMPTAWYSGSKLDAGLIKSINKKYGTNHKLKTFPTVSFMTFLRDFPGLKRFDILNYIDYDYQKAKQLLIDKLGWIDYGLKHYESVFTRFYQGYILPEKFGIDKRRAHLTSLIYSGQLTRDEALAKLEQEKYEPELLRQDREFLLKKLDFSEEEFAQYLTEPGKSYTVFNSYTRLLNENIWLKAIIKTGAFIKKPFNKLFKLS
ncbi:MAG: N-acetyl sugar amidotransferase [Ignavibacteriae bacterium]|nr:N-acetyl sugar amidotransferase [Ignavibacteriota bacterium]